MAVDIKRQFAAAFIFVSLPSQLFLLYSTPIAIYRFSSHATRFVRLFHILACGGHTPFSA